MAPLWCPPKVRRMSPPLALQMSGVCLSACLSACPPVRLSVCLPGLSICLVYLPACLPACLQVLFVMTFGLGLGPVTWLLPAELFPMRKRAAATGLATAVNWFVNFATGQVSRSVVRA